MNIALDPLRLLLDRSQRDLPLVSRPFAEMARQLAVEPGGDWTESGVLALFRQARDNGALSRLGPVFAPHGIGASTLAALAVPAAKLPAVADWINVLPQVNHNYRRSHEYNLWFVVTGRDEADVQATLAAIRAAWPELPLLDLPLVNAYYIDLGFGMDDNAHKPLCGVARAERRHQLTPREWALVALIQDGLPLVETPFAALARDWGGSEAEVIATLARWRDEGIVKRYGAVVRHRELGYRANAMCVFDIPPERLDEVAAQLAAAPEVRLCYERPRRGEAWPYNLFCMVHGKDRDSVLGMVEGLVERLGLKEFRRDVLIGEQRYKQRGAWYAAPAVAARSAA